MDYPGCGLNSELSFVGGSEQLQGGINSAGRGGTIFIHINWEVRDSLHLHLQPAKLCIAVSYSCIWACMCRIFIDLQDEKGFIFIILNPLPPSIWACPYYVVVL